MSKNKDPENNGKDLGKSVEMHQSFKIKDGKVEDIQFSGPESPVCSKEKTSS